MSNFNISYRYQLRDQFSDQMRSMARTANRATRDLRGAANAARRVAADLNAAGRNANHAGRGLRRLGTDADVAERKLHRLARRLRTIRSIRFGATGMFAGLGTTVAAHQVGSTLMGYEKSMNLVNANMVSHMENGTPILKGVQGGTAEIRAMNSKAMMAKLRDKTKQVARESIFDPSEVAGGLLELARAGATADEALTMLHPTVRLAAAGNLDVAQAVDIATNITKAFGKEVAETTNVVDILAMAASNTNTTVAQMGQSMKFAAPSAKVAGHSIEQTTAVLMSLAKRGLKDSIAGTSIARMLESIYKSSGPAVKGLKAIGLAHKDFMNADGTTITIPEILQKFKDAAKVVGKEKVIKAMQAMMQSRGSRAAKLLFESAIEEINANEKLLKMAKGRAALMEKLMMSGVYGAYERMRASIVESVISLGEGGLSKDLEYLADKVRGLANGFSKLDDATKRTIGRIFIGATAFTAIALPLGILIFSLSQIAMVLALIASPLGVVTAGFAALAIWLGTSINVGETVKKLQELHAAVSKKWQTSEMKSFFDFLGDQLARINVDFPGIFQSLATSTNPLAEAFRSILGLVTDISNVLLSLPEYVLNPSKMIGDLADWTNKKVSGVWDSLGKMGGALVVHKDQNDLARGSLAQSQADKDIALKVQTDTNVKITAPPSIVLKLPQGGVAGTISLKGEAVSRGVTTPEAGAGQ